MDVPLFRYVLKRALAKGFRQFNVAKRNIAINNSRCILSSTQAALDNHQSCDTISDSNNSILGALEEKIENNLIRRDDYQYTIVQSLQSLDDQLKNYKPALETIWDRLLGKRHTTTRPKGLYLWGSVGCGKTFLMDLFYKHCSVSDAHKKRIHFHRFMLDVHAEIHQIKMGKSHHKSNNQKNPIPLVAKSISSRSWLLCLDEFQVTDVADAMILRQLFTHLFDYGVILLATSNRQPDDLYKSGLQRSAFLPFIPMLKDNCIVKCLDSNIDYRKTSTNLKKIYFVTTKETEEADIDNIFESTSLTEDDIVCPRVFNVNSRPVRLSKTCGGVADCDFSEICQQPLGADDYDRMGKLFHTIIVRNIPQLTIKMKAEARRFITFIDMMYDNRVRVVFSARVPLEQLFRFDMTGEFGFEGSSDDNRTLIDDLGLNQKDGLKLSFITGEDEIFAFSRTVSRISEMQTNQYWDLIEQDVSNNKRLIGK